jgi:hypothetical protein
MKSVHVTQSTGFVFKFRGNVPDLAVGIGDIDTEAFNTSPIGFAKDLKE